MKRAMLVNDSRLEIKVLADLLSTIGFEVVVSNELKVLEDVKTIKPDLVMVNYVMKTIWGDVLIGNLKREYPKMVCILTSSSEIPSDLLKFRHFEGIVRTPVTLTALREVLGKAAVKE
jgi:CheY-like chemotaxis protein